MNIPQRPPIMVRAPERDAKNDKKMSASETSVNPALLSYMGAGNSEVKIEFTLYTNSSKCKYGEQLLKIAREKKFTFEHIDVSKVAPPEWLPGTPTLVHENNVYCGDAAFGFIDNFTSQQDSTQPALAAVAIEPEQPTNPFAKKMSDDSAGCGLSKAFAPPPAEEVDESKFSESTDQAMQRLLAGRR